MSVKSMALIGGLLLVASHAAAATLDEVKARGVLRCGVAPNNPGFAIPDAQGNFRGFDVDFCKGIAAAIFGDGEKGRPVVAEPRDAFTMLTTGAIDVLTHRFTYTFGRDNGAGMEFALVLFYDGQGFMVPRALNLKSARELNGATICVMQGTTVEINIADFFSANKIPYKVVTFAGPEATRLAYDEGRCDALSNDRSGLASRSGALKEPDKHMVLPETISNEPIGPWVRQGDPAWAHVVRWTSYALIAAEELGITQVNVEEMRKSSSNPNVRRLLGSDEDFGGKIGLSRDWAFNAIKAVGNYGEIFERGVGMKSPLKLSRGANALIRDGGLLYAPPIR